VAGNAAIPLPPRRPPAPRTSADQFADTAATLSGLRVDGADLAVINRYLGVVAEMTRIVRQTVDEADRAAQTSGGPHRYSSLGSDEIGGVLDISSRLSATAQMVEKNLADFAKAVDHTAEAITKIAQQYQSTDQRNRLNAEQVRKYLNR
jgi:hypothetical protein